LPLQRAAPRRRAIGRNSGALRERSKYQAALEGGHDVLVVVLISEVWGGFSPEAMRFLGELAQARNDGIDIERASTTYVVDVVLHLLPRPAALAGGAVGGRDRDRAGDQEERELPSYLS
jgi:hypothetical protein